VKQLCPGLIIQFSTGGRGRDPRARGSALYLKPDMASLSTGSVNFPTIVYENSATLVRDLASRMREYGVRPEIEIFDLSHVHGARRLVDEGLMDDHPHVQFVMGVQNAMPAEEHLLDILLGELKRVLPKATWTAAGIGRHQSKVIEWVLARRGQAIRTGLEDNIRINKDRLASSNAELVKAAANICARFGARPATPQEARAMLALPS
jgi:3-keto-5-aminohexanoate cleavage enzyme